MRPAFLLSSDLPSAAPPARSGWACFRASAFLCATALSLVLPAVALAQPAATAVAAAPGAPGAPVAALLPPPDAAATEILQKFEKLMKCEAGRKDPLRHLCALTRVGKDPIWTPGQSSAYVGVSFTLKTGGDLKKTIAGPMTLSALLLGPGAGRVMQVPGNDQAAATAVLTALKGETKLPPAPPAPPPAAGAAPSPPPPVPPVAISGALAEQLKKEKTQGRQPLKLDKAFAEFTDKSPTRLYRTETPTGPVFVSIETIGDGQQISLYPAIAQNN